MKSFFFILLLAASAAAADCDLAPLRRELIEQYSTPLTIQNEKGETGHGRTHHFVVSDHLLRVKNETFLVANFDLKITWPRGPSQAVKTLVVASVDAATCRIDGFEGGDTFGTSVSGQ